MTDVASEDPHPTSVTAELVRLEPAADHRRRARDVEPAHDPAAELPGLEPDRTLTDWGRSERLVNLVDGTLTEFLYHYWLRVETEGIENVPAAGGALLVANRAGQLPLEGAMVSRAVRERHPRARDVILAYERTFPGLPGLGMALTKLGAVRPHPANLQRLMLDEEQLVLVFPEGARGPRKPLSRRYRLRDFADHASLIEAAMRAQVPIVPLAVLGSEEATPTVTRIGLPIGLALPLPAKFRLRFLQPIRTDDLGSAPWRDRALVEELAEEIRALIQENLYELVAQRRSVWLG